MNWEHSKICSPNLQNAAGNKRVHSLSPRHSPWDTMVDLKNDILGKLSLKGRLKSSFWSSLSSDDRTNQNPLSLSEFSARVSIFAILHRKAYSFTGFGLGFFLDFTYLWLTRPSESFEWINRNMYPPGGGGGRNLGIFWAGMCRPD